MSGPRIASPTRTSNAFTAPCRRCFPLLCPVREAEWIDGWNPVLILTQSGFAEQDCVFVTDAKFHDAIWYITRHDPRAASSR